MTTDPRLTAEHQSRVLTYLEGRDDIDPATLSSLRYLATLDAAPLATPATGLDPYTDRNEHGRQSLAGTHNFDPQCPFCFFDRFDAETRANLALPATPATGPDDGFVTYIDPNGHRVTVPGRLASPEPREDALRKAGEAVLYAYDVAPFQDGLEHAMGLLRAALQGD